MFSVRYGRNIVVKDDVKINAAELCHSGSDADVLTAYGRVRQLCEGLRRNDSTN